MDTRQNKYTQMQSKLRNGLANLNNVSPDDSNGVGAGLAQLHGALEEKQIKQFGEYRMCRLNHPDV